MRLKALPKKLLTVAVSFLVIVISVTMLTQTVVEESNINMSSVLKTMYDSTLNKLSNDMLQSRSTNIYTDKFEAVDHESWSIKETDYVPEYKINVVTYTHNKTGGELVSFHWDKSEMIDPREQEKVFSIFFRTPVSDSTGVPHILEHSVLCGSDKFTTKEPFASVNQKSLNTFLNAFTWDDRTGFAFASCNMQDFKNSLDVYLDAVFHPRARNDTFVLAQEGWHLSKKEGAVVNERELVINRLRDIELEYSGVVYSEMKGAYSDSEQLMARKLQTHTFPDTGYKYDSGGDPQQIPSLTFDHFKEFYDKYYHPSNARTFVSGMDASTSELHDFLSRVNEYYKDYDAAPEKKEASKVIMQKKSFKKPVRKAYPYTVENDNDLTHMIAINWLINDKPISAVEEMALSVLNQLLLGTSSSILYKTLSESGLGNQVLDFGLEQELVQNTFAVGLKGVEKGASHAKQSNVELLIMNTLREIANNGFDDDTIESSLNFIEFHLRENESDGEPKGLEFMFASMSKYIYDYSPIDGIKFEESLAALRSTIEESKSQVFQDLIEKYLLNNNHRVIIDFYPSTKCAEENAQEERDRINAYKEGLSNDELRKVLAFADELQTKQATPDSEADIATIPHITLTDVDRTVVDYPNTVEENIFGSSVTVVSHTLSTAGILYADIFIDISALSLKMAAEKLPLYMAFLTETGTDTLNEVKFRESIEMHTGGVGVSTLISQIRDSNDNGTVVLDASNWVTKMQITGKSLAQKADKLFDIILSILTQSNLDNRQKAIELLQSSCASKKSSIISSGNSYALKRLQGRYTVAGAMSEKFSGVTSYEDCKILLEQVKEDWPSVLEDLKTIRTTIMDTSTIKEGLIINLTGDEDTLETVEPELEKFIKKLAGEESSDTITTPQAMPKTPAKISNAADAVEEVVDKVVDTVNKVVNAVKEDAKPQAGSKTSQVQHPWLKEAFETLKNNQEISAKEALIVPTQVSYVAKGNKIYEIGDEVNGSSSVVTSWLSTVYLWNTVRIQGNAYGAGANLDDTYSIFACSSYRDPNILSTLNFYDNVASWIKEQASEFKTKPEELNSAIIAALNEGSPPSNSQKGMIAFNRWLLGYTTEYRQNWRDEIFNTEPKDFEEFAQKLER